MNEFIKNQIQVNPIIENFSKRYTPLIVATTIKRLKTLVETHQFEADEVLLAFFEVNNPTFATKHGVWDVQKEFELDKAKLSVNNSGKIKFSEFSDIRILC